MEGVVTKKHVDQGAYVKEGSVIYSIANLDYLWVELDAYESDLQWLHYAQKSHSQRRPGRRRIHRSSQLYSSNSK